MKTLLIILSFLFLIDTPVFAFSEIPRYIREEQYYDSIRDYDTRLGHQDNPMAMKIIFVLLGIGAVVPLILVIGLNIPNPLKRLLTSKTTYTFICVISFLLWWVPIVFGPHLGIDLEFLEQFVTAKELAMYIIFPLLSINIICFLILMYVFD